MLIEIVHIRLQMFLLLSSLTKVSPRATTPPAPAGDRVSSFQSAHSLSRKDYEPTARGYS